MVRVGEGESFFVGHARRDITPPAGTWMAGYAGRTEPCEDAHDPLGVHMAAFSDGSAPVILAALDVCGVDGRELEELKEAIEAATTVDAKRVLVNCSHTHSGPNLRREGSIPFNEDYFVEMKRRSAEAAAEAMENLKPARFFAGEAPLDIGCNRRERNAEGEIVIGVAPDGPRLPSLDVWLFERDGAGDVALFSTPMHGTTLTSWNRRISSDWMGEAIRQFEQARVGARAMFLQGCAGNQTPYRRPSNFEMAARHGRAAASAIAEAIDRARRLDPLPLKAEGWEIELPYEDGSTGLCPLRGLRIGDAIILGLSGEPFVEYALHVREELQGRSVITLGYTDGSVGYLPTEKAYAEGGYETVAYQYRKGGKSWNPKIETIIQKQLRKMADRLTSAA